MKIQGFFGAHLTMRQPRKLLGVAEQKFNLKAGLVVRYQRLGVQLNVGRGQHNVTRLLRVFAIDQHDHAQDALQLLMPHPRRIQMKMRFVGQRTERRKAPQILPVNFAIIPARAAFLTRLARRGVQKVTVRSTAQFGDDLPARVRHRGDIIVFGIGTIHRQILDERGPQYALGDRLLRKKVIREASRWVLSGLPGGVCATAQVSA